LEADEFYQHWYERMMRDYDYYDGDQLTEEEILELESRDQPPIEFNRVQPTIDMFVGTESRTKFDMVFRPRGAFDEQTARLLNAADKYVKDQNSTDDEISDCWFSQLAGGLGILEQTLSPDPTREEILEQWVDFRDCRLDKKSKRYDYSSDARYIFRQKWMDVDSAVVLFPEYRDELYHAAGLSMPHGERSRPEKSWEADRPSLNDGTWDNTGEHVGWRADEWRDKATNRVLIVECWYRTYEQAVLLKDKLTGAVQEIDPDNPTEDQVRMMYDGPVEIVSAPIKKVRRAFFAGPNLLEDTASPFKHNRFPFTLFWGKRKTRTGEPYGVIRNMIAPQDVVNKNFSKMMWILGSVQTWIEAGAAEDINQLADDLSAPDAVCKLNPGGLNKVQRHEFTDKAHLHQQVMEMANVLLGENTGAVEELMGRPTNASSGYAIELRQAQGSTIMGAMFKNYRRSLKLAAEMRMALIQQTFDGPKAVTITDEQGAGETLVFNDEDNRGNPINPIPTARVDVVVDEQAYRASVRQAFAEQLMTMVSRMPEPLILELLDLVVEMSDPPRKAEVMRRIKAVQQKYGAIVAQNPNPQGGSPGPVATAPVQNQPAVARPVGGS